jgi:hypothetical protein
MRPRVGYQRFFRCAALELVLMTTIAVISASASAGSVKTSVSAVVIAPANVSDVTANLTIRLPGAGLPGPHNRRLHSASATSSTVSSNDCLQTIRILASCVKRMHNDGILNGDPVSNIMLNDTDNTRFARNDVGVTVTYN